VRGHVPTDYVLDASALKPFQEDFGHAIKF